MCLFFAIFKVNLYIFSLSMLLLFLLSTPFYVAIFWAILNRVSTGGNQEPRKMVSNFLFVASFVFLGNALFYEGLQDIYTVIDPLFILSTVLVHPIYYLYFRILTVDPKFEFKKHIWFFVPGLVIAGLYFYGSIRTGFSNHKEWLFSEDASSALPHTDNPMMDIYCLSSRILFLFQAIGAVWGSVSLLRKYGSNAENFYSDVQRTSLKNMYLVNYIMIAIALISIVDVTLGREAVKATYTGIFSQSLVYSVLIFVLGWFGHEQHIINPEYEAPLVGGAPVLKRVDSAGILWNTDSETNNDADINMKLQVLFSNKKIYLNPDLTILDVASAVGTNRTYLSAMINRQHNLNFCSFVNNYRYKQAELEICRNPNNSLKDISDYCGFGSFDSFRRTVLQVSGKALKDWKIDVLMSNGLVRTLEDAESLKDEFAS